MAALSGDWSVSPSTGESAWARVEETSAPAGVRRRATALAERLGFAGERLEHVRLAVTEAATNLVKHAGRGEMLVRVVRGGERAMLEFVSVDRGPGMADVPESLRDGVSTSGSLGIGLGMIGRLADDAGLHSRPGEGTILFARFRQPGEGPDACPSAGPPFAGLTRPLDGEEECGDAYAARELDGVVHAILCDGLGHGPLAARAAAEAVRAVRGIDAPTAAGELLDRMHRGLAGTRGAAVAAVTVDPAARRVVFAGLGNIAGWIVAPGRRRGMISTPGIAGVRGRGYREHGYDLPAGAAVVLHSDGLTGRWDLSSRPDLLGRDPLLAAGALLRDAGTRHDDRSVLVIGAGRR
ncbi:Serine/threonine-protein kinase RsbT [Actinomadura rubteroloni]|uniref:Serine/threonine-protein kinase RsbT n=1 Tax=Actinomadura rubteroloni TaxID=1926885 RepID=A0A2P4UD55_9ACTN|nr:ATP-binding SpoIIE family protein phosphatase [Actinomadura rubteroloni]POM22971.1 Serine/threonine-protein kinase RsbT [Actinomadura rubteroloni]